MSEFHIYDPNEVSILAANIPIEGGFADGTFVEVVFTSDAFVTVVGADGDVTRSKTNDRRARVTITLMQSSNSNQLLSALSNLDQNKSNGAGVGALLIKDNQGLSLYTAEHSWIAKHPDAAFDKTAGPRAWVFECAALVAFTGGN